MLNLTKKYGRIVVAESFLSVSLCLKDDDLCVNNKFLERTLIWNSSFFHPPKIRPLQQSGFRKPPPTDDGGLEVIVDSTLEAALDQKLQAMRDQDCDHPSDFESLTFEDDNLRVALTGTGSFH